MVIGRVGVVVAAASLLLSVSTALAADTEASPLEQPDGSAAPRPGYSVNGFRSATFGMTDEQVKAAIAQDFHLSAGQVRTETNPMQRTTALIIKTALPPGPGEATVSYILGASSHRLVHVNVLWASGPTPSATDRGAIAAAGLQLINYFRGQPWGDKTPAKAGVSQSGALVFEAIDARGGSVQVEAAGIPISRKVDGKDEATSPTGPAVLRVSYAQDAAHPDVFSIKPGAF
jgi:hypothetical protein